MSPEATNKKVKNEITESLINLLNKKTLDQISITEIVQNAKVGRNSFYRNFESKEDILEKYLTKITDEFVKMSNISLIEDTTVIYFTKLFTHLEKYKNLSLNLYKSNCMNIIEKQFHRIITDKHLNYDEYKRAFYIGGIYNIYIQWLKNNFKDSPSELANKLVDLLQQ